MEYRNDANFGSIPRLTNPSMNNEEMEYPPIFTFLVNMGSIPAITYTVIALAQKMRPILVQLLM